MGSKSNVTFKISKNPSQKIRITANIEMQEYFNGISIIDKLLGKT